eukprot:1421712-Prymnesium_polylepis.1
MVRAPWASGSVWQRLAASGRLNVLARLASVWRVWPTSGSRLGSGRGGAHGPSPLKSQNDPTPYY